MSACFSTSRGWASLAALALVAMAFVPTAVAADDAEAPVDYARQIAPLLAKNCVRCHGPEKQKSDLRVDSVSSLRKGGKIGPAVIPGRGEKSPLVQAILGTSNDVVAMPPIGEGDPLSDVQAALIRRWIDEGANSPDKDK